MGKIHRLSSDEIKKIAAGEVVERPANIVKELVENSLDAGASKVDIFIEDAGKKSIRIVDNGCGMSKEDAHACFEQHATSKLKSVNQLHSIDTYGFRGEALSSIASVSKVVLITKEANAKQGIKISMDYGENLTQDISSAHEGTDLSIVDIFSNVPARRKFLKTNATEWNQIVQLFQAFGLTYPSVHFTLHHEGRLIHNCPPVDLLEKRVTQLWDHQFANYMLDIAGEDKKINLKLEGFITNYQYSRYSRNQIYLFVNNRWVKNQKLSRALLRGYANVLQSGKFPAAFLFMTIDKEQVDINIHPRKEEVQFLHPRTVEQLITRCAKEKLEAQIKVNLQDSQKGFTFAPATKSSDTFPMDSTGPSINLANEKFEEFYEEPGTEFEIEFDPEGGLESPKISINSDQNKPEPQEKKKLGSMFDISNLSQQQRNLNEMVVEKTSQLEDIIQQSFHKLQYTLVGQLFKTYLMIERDEQLIMIDQHAAHERVLYELFSKKFESIATVNLMFPQTIHLSQHEFKLVGPYLELLRDHGIGIEEFGEAELVVSCTPVNIKNVDLQKFIQQVIGWIEEHDEVDEVLFKKQLNEHIHSHMACKAAVKAGDILEEEQIHQLIRDLEKSDNRLTCPHGRPTMWVVTQSEIEKNFKRKV